MSDTKEKKHLKGRTFSHLIGKILCIVELAIAICFSVLLWKLGVLPAKTFGVITGLILILSLICLGLQFTKRKYYILGILVSILLSIVLGAGCYYIHNVSKAMGKV